MLTGFITVCRLPLEGCDGGHLDLALVLPFLQALARQVPRFNTPAVITQTNTGVDSTGCRTRGFA